MFKKILIVVLTVILIIFAAGCSTKIDGTPQRYDDTRSLSAAVEFDVIQPGYIPEGYVLSGYYAVENKIAEILYINGEEELIFAMTKAKNVISDMGEFEKEQEYEFNGNKFVYSMNGDNVHLIVSYRNDMNYVVYSKSGLTTNQADAMCKGMFIADADIGNIQSNTDAQGIS